MGMSSLTGGGGLSASSSATSGDAEGTSGTGNKIFNLGGNPNVGSLNSLTNTLSNPVVVIGAIAIVWILFRKKR